MHSVWKYLLRSVLVLCLSAALVPLGRHFAAQAAPRAVANPTTTVFINEFHYDDDGSDEGEFIEVAGPVGTDLTGWTLVLYNGNGGTVYDTNALPSTIPNTGCPYGVVTVSYAGTLQNGAPDGIALVDNNGALVQFLSYEGAFTAVGGAADGQLSTDVGVAELGGDPPGNSLQLSGSGTTYGDFTWGGPTPASPGEINAGQSFGPCADTPPTVSSVEPADGATDVPVGSDIMITFSESVDVAEGAITVECPSGTVVASNGAAADVTSVTLDPAVDLPITTTCAINIDAAGVSDNDGTPDTLAGTTSFTFTTGGTPVTTLISAIQGSGNTAASGTFTIEGIVVGDYQTQGSGQLRGFFVQEEDSDADLDPATSEGIFVFCSSCPTPVSVGDKVRVTGASSEFFDMSQLTAADAASVSVLSTGNPLPTPATVQLPVPGVPMGDLAAAIAAINSYFEPVEGMLVTIPATLAVSEYFELARYGQVILSAGGRPHTFTAVNAPSATGLIDHEIDLARRTIILDDTDNRQNRPVDTPNTPYYHPVPGLSTGNFFRGGDTITNLTGVLHWSFAGQSGTDAWRIRPVPEAFDYAFTAVNPRPGAPDVGGSLRVASFNVLNYFLTIDTTSSNDEGVCSPSLLLDCRGADSVQEFDRQRAKLTQALLALDADIVGLVEIENTPGVNPPQQIADDLNAVLGAGTYSFIDTGPIGTDAIRVGMIYKPGTVTPAGSFEILDSTDDPNFIDTRNRPTLAQTFDQTANGERFTVVVNHLKSKGSGCGEGDDDTTTGQGNCNGTRTLAAQALANWLASDPTQSGDPDVLIIGDLNAYALEDPIVALQNAGYTDMLAAFGGSAAYSYVFDGQLGYLDHALASGNLVSQITGVSAWHINADEIPLFDYNDDVRDAGESSFEEESDSLPLYTADPYRTSDHDPVVVGLELATDTRATITIVKDARPDNPRNFRFRGDLGFFLLDDAADADAVGASRTFEVEAGTYTVIEDVPFKWHLTGIVCEGGSAHVDLAQRRVAITVAGGEDATCTFTNEYGSAIWVDKYFDRNHNGSRFFEMGLPGWGFNLFDANGIVVATGTTNLFGKLRFWNVVPGPYTLCETLRPGWYNSQPGTIDPTYGQPCYALNIGPAQLVQVQFGNHRTPIVTAASVATPAATNVSDLAPDQWDDEAYEDDGTLIDPDLNRPAQGEPGPIFLPSIVR